MTTSLLDDSWKNSVEQQDLLYTCIGRLHCNDIVRHARCAEIFITPKDEETPRWKIRSQGFDGVLVDRSRRVILCETGRLLRPVKVFYGADGCEVEGAEVTTMSVDSRYFCYRVKPRKHLFKMPPQHMTVAEYYPPRGGIGRRMPSNGPRILGQLITYNVDEAVLQHVLVLSAFNFYARFRWAKGRETLECSGGAM